MLEVDDAHEAQNGSAGLTGDHRRVRRTLDQIIDQRATELPNKVYLWIDDESHTFRDLRDHSVLMARCLATVGVGRGDVVAGFTRTCFDTVALLHGASRAGAMFMGVNTAFHSDYLVHQLRDSGAKVILIDEDLLDKVEPLVAQLPALTTLLVRSASFEEREIGHVVARQLSSVLELAASFGGELDPLAWNDPAFVFYTSGTTGPSKGVVLTQNYMVRIAEMFLRNFGAGPDDVQYAAVPLFHVSGSFSALMPPLVGGYTTVLDTSFHVSTCWDRIRERGATMFFGVGAMVLMLWSLPPDPSDADLPIRLMLAAPIPVDLWRAIEERYQCTILSGYGQTEGVQFAAQVVGHDNIPGSSGKPIECFEMRTVDENDDDVPLNTPGQIVVRPTEPHVMFEGYLGRPRETMEQMHNLWYHTGDLGRFDEHGNLWFVDRTKDVIRRKGENISSFEVEAVVRDHPDVAECAAVAVPNDLIEDDVMIVVIPVPGRSIEMSALMDHCAQRLPRFAIPRYVEVVETLPKTLTGRVQKHLLRSAGVQPSTWDSLASGSSTARGR